MVLEPLPRVPQVGGGVGWGGGKGVPPWGEGEGWQG